MQIDHKQKLEVFSQLLELGSDAMVIRVLNGGIVFWNQGAQRLFGYTEEEALSYAGKDFLKPTYSIPTEEVYRTLTSEGYWVGDITEVRKDGKSIIVAARLQSIVMDGKQVILSIKREVTQERKQAQRVSTQARLLQLCPDAIIETQCNHGVTFWNEGAKTLYGYTESDVTGKNLKDLLQSSYPQPYEEILKVLEHEGRWQGDVRERNKAGEQITVSSSIQLYKHGGTNTLLIANRDVTTQRGIQSKLLALNKALVASNRELDEFTYITTHDLKEPFRGIAINADILLREDLPEKAQARVRRMSVLCQRIDHLLSDLLYFSRLANAEKPGTSIDPNDTIGAVRAELQDLIRDRSGTVGIETELPSIKADPLKVKKVFSNLISNGLLFNNSDNKVVDIGFLPCVDLDGMLMNEVFYVRDNGIGIETKNQAKIFQFFKRLNREEDYGFGTGAGLSIVKKIIERYGGEISLISQPGQGTTFYFTLPLDGSIKSK